MVFLVDFLTRALTYVTNILQWTNRHKVIILPLSDIGEVTARILGFKSVERLLERKTLREISRYPTVTEASQRMKRKA